MTLTNTPAKTRNVMRGRRPVGFFLAGDPGVDDSLSKPTLLASVQRMQQFDRALLCDEASVKELPYCREPEIVLVQGSHS